MHTLKRQLQDESVIEDFLKQRKVEEMVILHAQTVSAGIPSKYVIKLESDGSVIPPFSSYKISGADTYTNQLYEGKVVRVNYSDEQLVRLQIESTFFDPQNPITLTVGTLLRLKYIGGIPVPAKTKPIFVEIVIEGNVVN